MCKYDLRYKIIENDLLFHKKYDVKWCENLFEQKDVEGFARARRRSLCGRLVDRWSKGRLGRKR